MIRILIVEDELQMQRGLKDNLEYEGYDIRVTDDGIAAEKIILEESFNLILLDVMLPGKSGFDILSQIRRQGITTPVIMLTAKGEEIDRVLGLEMGADDYITKPFSLRELLARVKAVLRRYPDDHERESQTVTIGRLNICFQTYNAEHDGEPISMSSKEFDILKCLWEGRNHTVSRDHLLDKVWGYDSSVTTRTVDNFILKLRKRVEVNPANPKIILTIHGIGYKLILPNQV